MGQDCGASAGGSVEEPGPGTDDPDLLNQETSPPTKNNTVVSKRPAIRHVTPKLFTRCEINLAIIMSFRRAMRSSDLGSRSLGGSL